TWPLPQTLDDGGWLLSYVVISSDSHPISGTIRFVVGDAAATFGDAPAPKTFIQYPRFLLLLGALTIAGLLIGSAVLGYPLRRAMKTTVGLAALAVVAGCIGSIYATEEAAGGGPVAIAAAVNALGPSVAVVLVGLAAGIAAAWLGYRWLAALGGLV